VREPSSASPSKTVTLHFAVILGKFLSLAVITAVCPGTAVTGILTNPVEETVATALLLLVHVTSVF